MSNAYLEVRAALALAKLASITDPATDRVSLVIADAQALGLRDATLSATSDLPVPIYFADEPSLLQAWRSGVLAYESEEEMSGMCSFCFKGHETFQCPHL
ncbi:hypothetical protein QYH69_22230 [Paraburkholderia sp. SARCC-3016]|uniref:hypothetical protein n=1 Tax=Paraburkholderia sp. SARCC-3016 TaxID=3058611 RepID=UPI002807D98A|nr:hypothetical protein [Paraburkholderia sp. SARCC-3016]MDQ7979963.1 hypothetical protein [Paraburkholderia sp. SARCC-3016]